ncbi:thiamine pyrophosphate-dependent dehydrogenase E1 component subunit alpha [Fusibacter paucivorans]|uniref:Thiamine pyrophosphate-dependent dehydrogenase E1 component subunit alpha n=1 Tax=Fusibacter paucivorans TaxID=76009 RepID=A0ABS5PTT8_9FIRM|nr:thiamine pyrophosphate-dependent dehydrogenase E1 component subunit alpha [Fusibacter paucivorans]MBS7528580.1 thiamine pyrophosphate-dependent dehydrogenase E1 component subunit alpha [Fusibacter paucivorans]
MKYSNEELVSMYRQMIVGRVYCDSIEREIMKGKVIGMHHLSQGQEAVSVGVAFALKEDDWILPTHRWQAGLLKILDIKKFAAEQYGKVDGYCQGMGCDFHMSSKKDNMIYSNGIMGQNFPTAVGFAHSLKRAGKGQVVVAGEGDGAFSEGINYEAFIFAEKYEEPVVFVVEDNGYAISYKSSSYKKNLAERGNAFGIDAVTVDGNDVIAVREAVETAIESARNCKPCMVEVKTLRWGGHYVGGDPQKYRTKKEVEELEHAKKYNDPIKRLEETLVNMNILDQGKIAAIWQSVTDEVEEALEFAYNASYPSADVILDSHKVYAQPMEV